MIHLTRINRVYRFSIYERTWARSAGAADHCLAYKLYGRTVHIHDGREYIHDQDSVMIVGKDDLYRVTAHDPESAGARGGCIAVHFETAEPFDLPMACIDVSSDRRVRSGFFRLLDAWKRLQGGGGAADECACAALFYDILARTLAIGEDGAAETAQNIAAARAYMERNYADSALSMEELAGMARLSARRFGEQFQRRYHITPGRFLTALRIKAAEKLLENGDLRVSEVAALCGYASAGYFIRAFRRETGITPEGFRAERLKK